MLEPGTRDRVEHDEILALFLKAHTTENMEALVEGIPTLFNIIRRQNELLESLRSEGRDLMEAAKDGSASLLEAFENSEFYEDSQ